jgi:hypothetical protein
MAVAAAYRATFAAINARLPGWRAARAVALVALQAHAATLIAARQHP